MHGVRSTRSRSRSVSWSCTQHTVTSRRAPITPQRAGLPTAGRRRVPGLRRSEVAALGSVEYYAKLEGGSLAGVSAGVLDAIARALQWTLDAITDAPAILGNRRLDLLAANHLGRAMYCDVYTDTCAPPPASPPTRGACTTSSGSCPLAVTTSAAAGAPTTLALTATVSRSSTITR